MVPPRPRLSSAAGIDLDLPLGLRLLFFEPLLVSEAIDPGPLVLGVEETVPHGEEGL